jgi:hypothetical protein
VFYPKFLTREWGKLVDLLKKLAIAFVAVLAIGASVASGSSSTEDDGSGDSTSTEQTEAPAEETDEPAEETEEPAEESEAGVGDAVRDGKFEFTVTDVESGLATVGENEFLTQDAQGEFTLVSMKVENIGDEAQTFFSDNVTGTDSKDRELASDSTGTLYANEGNDSWISEINPGNSIEAIVVFDVAKGETLESVELKDSAFSAGVTVVVK